MSHVLVTGGDGTAIDSLQPSRIRSVAVGLHRVNVGCGRTPTPGWINFDNSLSVRLAPHPGLLRAAARAGMLNENQLGFARDAASKGVRWANATRRIPLQDASAEVVYTSHMLEHLDRAEARTFLAEVFRILGPGGIVRIAVPDIARLLAVYAETRDADAFVAATRLASPRPRGTLAKIRALVVGARQHAWMYDGASLSRLLAESGFEGARILAAGETTIPDPRPLNLAERESESVYVEARRHGAVSAP